MLRTAARRHRTGARCGLWLGDMLGLSDRREASCRAPTGLGDRVDRCWLRCGWRGVDVRPFTSVEFSARRDQRRAHRCPRVGLARDAVVGASLAGRWRLDRARRRHPGVARSDRRGLGRARRCGSRRSRSDRCGRWFDGPDQVRPDRGGFEGLTDVFGVLSRSAWPDVTVFIVAVLFGARTVIFGVSQLISLFSRRAQRRQMTEAPALHRGCFRLVFRVASRVVGLVIVVGLLALSVVLHGDGRTISDFYDTPSEIPATPGVLLRTEAYDAGIPTTRSVADDVQHPADRPACLPMVATAVVLAPKALPSVLLLRWLPGLMAPSASTGDVRRRCRTCRFRSAHRPVA